MDILRKVELDLMENYNKQIDIIKKRKNSIKNELEQIRLALLKIENYLYIKNHLMSSCTGEINIPTTLTEKIREKDKQYYGTKLIQIIADKNFIIIIGRIKIQNNMYILKIHKTNN
jgi:hypothetical protein